ARLFTFGVGDDVNRLLLERLGHENRGGVDYVDGRHTIDEVVGGFYGRISRPVLSDLGFKFGAVTTAMMYPDVLPDLYKGSQLVAAVRPSRVKPGDPTVRVRAPREATVRVYLPAWNEVKQARWSEDDGLWIARFLVPADTRDGTYPVKVEIAHADGRKEWVE